MKKLVLILFIIIVIVVIGFLVYRNSYQYSLKIAENTRDQKLLELSRSPKWAIPTGVYSFDCYEDKYIRQIDKFGQSNTSKSTNYSGRGEVSFTYSPHRGQVFVIIANGIKEEIRLGDVKVLMYNDMTTYTFDLLSWEAQYIGRNELSFKYDTSSLSFNKPVKEYAFLRVYSKDMNQSPSISLSTFGYSFFRCNNSISIELEKMEYSYNDINPYEYSDKAKFSLSNGKDVYAIDTYLITK
jgi:hypothetical protein